ncbi:MAG: hypothetical protein SGJ10_00310 [Bacteroidota bacterium]|nr:hypothetical protein [Bacteroidota bacterium]
MQKTSKHISDFIREFQLEHPTKGVCFDAKVYVFTAALTFQVESEIHIMTKTSKVLDTINILNPELEERGLPNMFEIGKAELAFKLKKGLMIKGVAPHQGDYTILIQPTGKDCEEPTSAEFHPKVSL